MRGASAPLTHFVLIGTHPHVAIHFNTVPEKKLTWVSHPGDVFVARVGNHRCQPVGEISV